MQANDIPATAVNAGHDLMYLTGLDFHISERPAILLLRADAKAAFIFPEFEKDKVAQSLIPLEAFPYPEDPAEWPNAAKGALQSLDLTRSAIAVSPTATRYLEIDLLQKGSADIRITSGEDIFRDIYIQKDKQELDYMREAVEIAQNALLATLPEVKPGVSEKQIANQLVINLLKLGSEPDLPFNPIVASGPNSANPHAAPGERKLQKGDLLIIDWGARVHSYISDITRTFAIGAIPDGFEEIGRIVLEANRTARQTAKPGLTGRQVDAVARDVITQAGYGENFLHRTGHGIGLEAHEAPFISPANTAALKTGMTFTIEPGIYLTGKGGIRIEDNVVLTADGVETLTSLPRELKVLK
jgi:Xaa-Pro dipeptidase